MRRPQGGYTLIELMVVVAIVGILSTLAAVRAHRGAGAADVARRTAGLLSEISRQAVTLGPALAGTTQARTQAVIGANGLTVYFWNEEGTPDWYESNVVTFPTGVRLAGCRRTPEIVSGTVPEAAGDCGLPRTVNCFPNGSCDGVTLYFERTNGTEQNRVVLLPLNGVTIPYAQW